MQYNIEGYNCQHYDLKRLADIDKTQKYIHEQYTELRIDIAANNLLELENTQVSIIAFSMGGTIAWRAALNGLNVEHLIVISSTRLRLETEKPNCKTSLLYGELDNYKSDNNWFSEHNLVEIQKLGKDHEIYKDKNIKNEIELILSDGQ